MRRERLLYRPPSADELVFIADQAGCVGRLRPLRTLETTLTELSLRPASWTPWWPARIALAARPIFEARPVVFAARRFAARPFPTRPVLVSWPSATGWPVLVSWRIVAPRPILELGPLLELGISATAWPVSVPWALLVARPIAGPWPIAVPWPIAAALPRIRPSARPVAPPTHVATAAASSLPVTPWALRSIAVSH